MKQIKWLFRESARGRKIKMLVMIACSVTLLALSALQLQNPPSVQRGMVCANTCPGMTCDGGEHLCWHLPCCDEEDLPCTDDEVYYVTCFESE